MYEKQSRNTNRSTDTIASFLLKTYEILDHSEYQRIISWEKSGVGFIIHDVVLFTREILPKYFRHSNFSSFVRQLNMYDFHKVKQQNEILVFKNPLFCKGQQQNLKFIRRKAAKKITGQKRTHLSEKNEIENEKYQNLLKGFKKSFQTQINQTSVFYEKSLQTIKQLNDSNLRKKIYMKNIFGEQQKIETTQQIKNMPIQTKNEEVQIPKPKKDTIIQIPKEFLQTSQVQENKSSLSSKQQQKQKSNYLNLDNLMMLKQEVYQSLGNYQSWLQDFIQTQKKKIRYINGYRQQLIKCRQTKISEINGNQQHDINQKNNEKDNQSPLEDNDEIFENNLTEEKKLNSQSEKSLSKQKQIGRNQKKQPSKISIQNKDFKNQSPEKMLISTNSNLKNQLFPSIIKDQSQIVPKLFSAFSKSQNYQQVHRQNNNSKNYQAQDNFLDGKVQKIYDFSEKQKNKVQGSF